MAQVIKPAEVSIHSVNGEVLLNIKLDININLTQHGAIQGVTETNKENKIEEKNKEDKTLWEIPNFSSVPKIKFGNKEQT